MNSTPLKVNAEVMSRPLSFVGEQMALLFRFSYGIKQSMICIQIL